ncbi:4-hydroxyphenylpyruvate dioxygenase [Leptolyngbya sp. AN02str]|uniref:4-hydroxyphenylpyruvate dioxygenase n=1 Tax=Leptolyngbya sp. AN02str TaxID=3423363 RepID=UPI003D30F9DE
MEIDHVHFYVHDAASIRDWFVEKMGFRAIALHSPVQHHTQTAFVCRGSIKILLSSAIADTSPVARYLTHHPPGVVDVAFRIQAIAPVLAKAMQHGALCISPLQQQGRTQWCAIAGWDGFQHTLIQGNDTKVIPSGEWLFTYHSELEDHVCCEDLDTSVNWSQDRIDHAVLNVVAGQMEAAVQWYCAHLGFLAQQQFTIQTRHSGLCSRVLVHPHGTAQLPINEPTSANSQIQEFLDYNHGAGIQHIAIQTSDAIATIAELRQRGLAFLSVPSSYYEQLIQRAQGRLSQEFIHAIAQHHILIDWQPNNPQAMLLQAFTQPIFDEPTFFFEVIERKVYVEDHQPKQAKGFGEGNFRALFEAMEHEQLKRAIAPLSAPYSTNAS